ncbi:MAG: hypothetical protein HQK97_13215, partial [Nitrospirae bacterium]|nr:hypothetical protein [Nitrospirota bacterium]
MKRIIALIAATVILTVFCVSAYADNYSHHHRKYWHKHYHHRGLHHRAPVVVISSGPGINAAIGINPGM